VIAREKEGGKEKKGEKRKTGRGKTKNEKIRLPYSWLSAQGRRYLPAPDKDLGEEGERRGGGSKSPPIKEEKRKIHKLSPGPRADSGMSGKKPRSTRGQQGKERGEERALSRSQAA